MDEAMTKALEAINAGITTLSATVTDSNKAFEARLAKLEAMIPPEETAEEKKAREEKEAAAKADAGKVDMSAITNGLKELSAKMEAVSLVVTKLGAPGASASPAAGNTPPPATKDFKAVVEETMAADKCDKTTAIRKCVVAHPDLHKAFIASGAKSL